MWQPGEVVNWRGLVRDKLWHVQPTLVVNDAPEEIAVTLLPGTECMADENYPKGKQYSPPHWRFPAQEWRLAKYIWRTNRLLLLFEPEKFYSTILFWNHISHEFVCYYINFQVPFVRGRDCLDTLDLDLDLVIRPDFSHEWKDEADYNEAVRIGAIAPQWVTGIEEAKAEVFDRLAQRAYPFDGSWRDWRPHPNWQPPTLPESWDRVE